MPLSLHHCGPWNLEWQIDFSDKEALVPSKGWHEYLSFFRMLFSIGSQCCTDMKELLLPVLWTSHLLHYLLRVQPRPVIALGLMSVLGAF